MLSVSQRISTSHIKYPSWVNSLYEIPIRWLADGMTLNLRVILDLINHEHH